MIFGLIGLKTIGLARWKSKVGISHYRLMMMVSIV